ncbi:hypothetical protein CITRIK5_20011 [Citricoccus sp. K5]|nr:hypothetical protein CITRIK5_20011 [Citricoccus sp. K5]
MGRCQHRHPVETWFGYRARALALAAVQDKSAGPDAARGRADAVYTHVTWMACGNLSEGYADGVFHPGRAVQRGETAKSDVSRLDKRYLPARTRTWPRPASSAPAPARRPSGGQWRHVRTARPPDPARRPVDRHPVGGRGPGRRRPWPVAAQTLPRPP